MVNKEFFKSCYISGMSSDVASLLDILLSDKEKDEVIERVKESSDPEVYLKFAEKFDNNDF